MTHTTRWSPDTCGCTVEYEWDDAVPQDLRVHTPAAVVHRCAAHAALADAAVHAAVGSENMRKNTVEARLRSAHAIELVDPVTGELVWSWSFDVRRELVVDLPVLRALDRTALQAWADTTLGAGRVVVR